MAKMYSIYDPSVDAFREVSLENAKQFVESAESVKSALIADGEL